MNEKISPLKTELDWSAYESYGNFGGFDSFGSFGESDAAAPAPSGSGGFAKAAAVCAGKRHCHN
jgi:hypothetical protein